MSTMTETRLLEIIASYGAKPERWPEEERAAALLALESSTEARRAMRDEAGLDSLLGSYDAPPSTLALQTRIAAIPEQRPARLADILRDFWPFGAIWQPASGLALAAVIGVMVGIGLPQEDFSASASTADTEAFAAVIAAAGGDIEESLQ